jgi:rod shape-determining protein MreC
MRGTSIAALITFVVLVVFVLIVPAGCKQQWQAAFLNTVAPLFHAASGLTQGIGGVSGGFKKLDELEKENRELKEETAELRTSNSLLKNLESEVNRLNKALGYRERSPFKLLPAHVISRENAAWWNSCTIDRGSADGVGIDMAVVTEAGLVGKIVNVSKNAAIVLLVSDEGLKVSVSIEGTQEQGIVSGTRASSNYVPDLRVGFISKTAEIKPGMKVFTSGTGGVFPSGVLVGTVKGFAIKELEGVATVEPAVDLTRVEDVFVITGAR